MKEQSVQRLLYSAGVLATMAFIALPVMYMVSTALARRPDFLSVSFVPTLRNFREILTSPTLGFPRYLLNSCIVSAISGLVTTLIAGCGAYVFTRFRFRGRLLLMVLILCLSMFPQISIVGYLFKMLSAVGLVNTWPGLILPYTAWVLPLSLWILVSYFSQIPVELDHAAYVDGCTPVSAMVQVVFPIAAPGFFSTLLLAFIASFNEFMFALMLTSDTAARTVPVGISLFQGLHGELPWGAIMAASTITTAPVVLLTLVFQRYIIQGLTRGALKG